MTDDQLITVLGPVVLLERAMDYHQDRLNQIDMNYLKIAKAILERCYLSEQLDIVRAQEMRQNEQED